MAEPTSDRNCRHLVAQFEIAASASFDVRHPEPLTESDPKARAVDRAGQDWSCIGSAWWHLDCLPTTGPHRRVGEDRVISACRLAISAQWSDQRQQGHGNTGVRSRRSRDNNRRDPLVGAPRHIRRGRCLGYLLAHIEHRIFLADIIQARPRAQRLDTSDGRFELLSSVLVAGPNNEWFRSEWAQRVDVVETQPWSIGHEFPHGSRGRGHASSRTCEARPSPQRHGLLPALMVALDGRDSDGERPDGHYPLTEGELVGVLGPEGHEDLRVGAGPGQAPSRPEVLVSSTGFAATDVLDGYI